MGLKTVFVAAAVLVLLTAVAWAGDLYCLRFEDRGALLTAQSLGARVRHIGNHVALLEWDGGDLPPSLSSEGLEKVGSSATGEDLYVCYPHSSGAVLSRYGLILCPGGGGSLLMSVNDRELAGLRSQCFQVSRLPASIDVEAWFDDSPPPLVGSRTRDDELAVRGVVEDVISSVSVDSLMAYVRHLSEYPDGTLKTRYVTREECLSEAKPYIVNKLRSYLPAGAIVDTQRFEVLGYSCENDSLVIGYPADNIVGTLPGTGRLGGYYVVCAHYDAIAAHSFPGDYTWWCDNPAPGADDNGTGVAIVLEAARVLSGLSFPFDVRFSLWTGEELGLLGSTAYADSVAAEGDTIYGVLNVDMVGYKRSASAIDTCHVVTNPGSTWLAQWLIDTTDLYPSAFDDMVFGRIDSALQYSDHASFWREGYDGIVAVEHWNPRERNPYYHTTGDTIGNVSPEQFAGVGRAVAGSMARLSEPDGTINLAIFPEDVSIDPSDPETDDIVHFSVKVHAFGPEEHVDLNLTAWDGDPDEGELLAERDLSRTMGGGEVIYESFLWIPGPQDVGEHDITLRLRTDGTTELSTADNEAVLKVRVADNQNLFIMEHFTYPNPSGNAGALAFRYELSRQAGAAEVDVFDLTGQQVGHIQRTIGEVDPNMQAGISTGWNTMAWRDFDEGASSLASGVYIYRLTVYAEGDSEPADEVSGKFAVVR